MIRARFLIVSAISVPLLGLGACQSPSKTTAPKPEAQAAKEKPEADEHEENEGPEGELMHKPATPLAIAIATAQKSIPDAQFLQAEVEEEGGKMICSVRFATPEGEREVNIDATTGKILETQKEELDPNAGKLLEELGADPKPVLVGAEKAIEAALVKVPNSWALAAGLTHEEGGKLIYAVFLIEGKTAHVAEVSASDGNVQKVSDAAMEEDEGDEAMEESKEKEKEEAPPAKPK